MTPALAEQLALLPDYLSRHLLLSITALQARQVLGYTMIAMCAATPIFLFWLAVL